MINPSDFHLIEFGITGWNDIHPCIFTDWNDKYPYHLTIGYEIYTDTLGPYKYFEDNFYKFGKKYMV